MTDQVFKDRAKVYPQLEALQNDADAKPSALNKISIGDDNRNGAYYRRLAQAETPQVIACSFLVPQHGYGHS